MLKGDPSHTGTINLVNQIPPNTYKTLLDAKDSYHAVELDEESCDLTTFITEWGRYRYTWGPQGFIGTGDFYTHHTYDITMEFQNKVKCVDDTLLFANSVVDAFWDTFNFLHHCSSLGMTFNPAIFKFAQTDIDFAGFRVKPDGFVPSHDLLNSIADFPTPRNLTGIRSWYGLVNQVSWADKLQPDLELFRQLLRSKGATFQWTEELDNLFQSSKTSLLKYMKEYAVLTALLQTGAKTASDSLVSTVPHMSHCRSSIILPKWVAIGLCRI